MAENLYIKEEERPVKDNREFFQEQKTLMREDSGLTTLFGTISMKNNGQINLTNKNNQVKLNTTIIYNLWSCNMEATS